MQLSIQRLRWVLLAGALLLVITLAAYIGYGRYRALRTYTQLLQRNGITITHETDGFTVSQSVKGKTVFSMHAAKAVQHDVGQWTLHDTVMTLYGREPGVTDHIYSSEVEYDEKQGLAHAQGEVDMDLQAPQALIGNHAEPSRHDDAALIHVRTSGLVYLRKLGVAATDQPVEFRYGGVQCTARGAEFNTGQSTLRLLQDVRMTTETHGQPVVVTADHADMDRIANVANLTRPVVNSLGRSARADVATLNLRKDGTLEHAQGSGNVVLRSETPHAGAWQVTAARLDASFNEQTEPQMARLSGGVALTDTNPLRPMNGAAAQVDAGFNAQGTPTSVIATGGAKIAMSVLGVPGATADRGLQREVQAAKIVALFAPGAKGVSKNATQIRQVTATGGARARGESPQALAKGVPVGALKSTLVLGDELQLNFAAGSGSRPQPQTLHGSGHTVLQQDASLGEQETSSGDILEITFAAVLSPKRAAAPAPMHDQFSIASAMQTGHVAIRYRAAAKPGADAPGAVSTGSAEQAVYDGATQKLTLTGEANLTGDNASLTAPTVVIDQESNVAEAFGGVRATLENVPAAGAAPPAKPSPATHVVSANARFEHEGKIAIFRGTDAQPARLWQDASQVQAAELLFDGLHHTFSARPAAAGTLIHAVFTGSDSPKPATKPEAKPATANLVRVASPKMDYDDVQRKAIFSGGVQMEGTLGEVRAQRALVYLAPATPASGNKPTTEVPSKPQPTSQPNPMSGSLERVVVLGNVQLEQPGRHGTGEQLVYTSATDNFVLTGTPEHRPTVVDTQQGNVTGTTLTFGAAGSTISVAGEPGATAAKHGRVHTETEVRQ